MLQHQPTVEALQHIVRGRICVHCDFPQRKAAHGPDAIRACEDTCPLFRALPHLQRILVCTDPSLRSCDQTLLHAIEHAHEQYVRVSGARHAHRCPLCRYSRQVVSALCEIIH